MSARGTGSLVLAYSEQEIDLALRSLAGLHSGRVPCMTAEQWERAAEVATALDILDEEMAAEERRAS